jgi:DNA polymerase III subunit alpha, Gram-positive type
MKISKEIVVLDLEATSSLDAKGNQVNNDIIEIGAVYLDTGLNIVDKFQCFVKPREPVSQFITELTGITNQVVESAPEFKDVAIGFEKWITNISGSPKKVILAAWGTYFDIPLLRRMYQEHNTPYPFHGGALDVKSVAFAWLSLSGHRTDKLGVEHVADIMGISAKGEYHRAVVDATAEARILQRCLWDLDGSAFLETKVGAPYDHIRLVPNMRRWG